MKNSKGLLNAIGVYLKQALGKLVRDEAQEEHLKRKREELKQNLTTQIEQLMLFTRKEIRHRFKMDFQVTEFSHGNRIGFTVYSDDAHVDCWLDIEENYFSVKHYFQFIFSGSREVCLEEIGDSYVPWGTEKYRFNQQEKGNYLMFLVNINVFIEKTVSYLKDFKGGKIYS